jgi:hypothetical protein
MLGHSGGADVALDRWILHDQGGRLRYFRLRCCGREWEGGPRRWVTENAATSAAQGTLECRNKDVRSLGCENLRCGRSICRFCKLLIAVSYQTTAKSGNCEVSCIQHS